MNKNLDEQQKIDDLVSALDNLMSEGSGHINIKLSDDSNEISVQTTNSTDCSCVNGACAQPTELLVDDDEELL
ncbi:MAG: hypothetical protein R3Y27_06325 [Clostridia bacterium]